MPKRRRLLTTPIMKNKYRLNYIRDEDDATEALTPRGRLKGALMDALETAEETDASSEPTPTKHDGAGLEESREESSSEEFPGGSTPPRQSYVLKLFDRSVDLSQFHEDSPLYPICRAWIANQPKANYKKFGSSRRAGKAADWGEESAELPGPRGPPVPRAPPLLPEQEARSKDNINLNYRLAPPPSRAQLLAAHSARWTRVRRAWLQQAAAAERRYDDTQKVLSAIVVNGY